MVFRAFNIGFLSQQRHDGHDTENIVCLTLKPPSPDWFDLFHTFLQNGTTITIDIKPGKLPTMFLSTINRRITVQ